MRYNVRFRELLGKIDSRIAKELIGLSWAESQKEIDVNTNYIEIIADKDDMVSFRPDDKVAEVGKDLKGKSAKTAVSGAHYDRMSQNILGDKYRTPANGQIGVIEREITKEEAGDGWEHVYRNSTLVVFMWRDSQGEGRCVFDRRSLDFSPEAVKPSEIGVGRLVRGLLSKAGVEFNDSEIEDFVYKYRTEVAKLGDVYSRFKLLEGEDIRKYYHHDKYESDKGTLGSSCMRYNRCQEYLDIYVKNPDQCKLVVLMSDEKDDAICGRAILWTDHDGRGLMDRIYTNRTQDEQLFKDFAKKNGFYHKRNQNMSEDEPFITPDGEQETIGTKIVLSQIRYDYFPYMDSFKYFFEGHGDRPSYLTNSSRFDYDFELTDTDGGHAESGCDCCGGDETVECYECNGRGSFRCQSCDGGVVECGVCGGAHEMECPDCDGSGKNEDDSECSGCSGTGTHTCDECGGKDIQCEDCRGEGRIECDDCEGDGNVPCPECQ